jgi:hypothetical protein
VHTNWPHCLLHATWQCFLYTGCACLLHTSRRDANHAPAHRHRYEYREVTNTRVQCTHAVQGALYVEKACQTLDPEEVGARQQHRAAGFIADTQPTTLCMHMARLLTALGRQTQTMLAVHDKHSSTTVGPRCSKQRQLCMHTPQGAPYYGTLQQGCSRPQLYGLPDSTFMAHGEGGIQHGP